MQTSASAYLGYPSTDTTTYNAPHLSLSSRDLKIRNNHRRTLSSIHMQGAGENRNSSLQKVWAEDYYESEDNEGGNTFDPRHAIPLIHTSANTLPFESDLQEESLPRRPLRTHQRSLTALLPFRNSTSRSPERKNTSTSIEVDSFMPTLTGDKDGVINVADKSKGGIASWFTGTSAVVPVGIPAIDPETTPDLSSTASPLSMREPSPERGKLGKRPTLPIPEPTTMPFTTPTRTNTSATATTSRFGGFFSSPKTPTRPANTVQIPVSQAESDPLLTDLLSALYPASGESDTFSPAAYKNLQMNAEGTILKLQTAYKIQLAAVHEIAAERDAVREEKEESDLKAQCLQGKIEAMLLQDAEKTAQIEEQQSAIQDLITALALEKQARAEEQETRERSIALLKAQAEAHEGRPKRSSTSNYSIDSTGEDLGISTARRNRNSRDSEMSISVESDVDSIGESVFSRSRSPTFTVNTTSASSMRSSVVTSDTTPEVYQASFARVVPNPSHHPNTKTPVFLPRPKTTQQKSTFQKLLSGMSNTPEDEVRDPYENIGMSVDGCSNCRGRDSSAAWDAVGLMRAENRGLKERIGELEVHVEAALDLIRF